MLKQRAFRATLWSAVEQFGARSLGMIFMLVFARFLSLEAFGIFAAAALVTGFAAKLAGLGVGTTLVQRETLDDSVLSTAFFLSMAAAIGAVLGLFALAGVFADLFGHARIAEVLRIMALGVPVAVANLTLTALLRRNLDMKRLASRTLVANMLAGFAAMGVLFAGGGVWALVTQSLLGGVLTFGLTLLLIGWPVRARFDRGAARDVLRFGLPIMGADLLTHYNRESPRLFVGLFLGTETLGLFAMATRVMSILLDLVGVTLSKVSLPVMSEINRASPARLGEVYLRLVRIAACVILPAFALTAVLAGPLIALLLGPKWAGIVPLIPFLCGAGLFTALNYINASTIVASGRPGLRLWFSTLRAGVGTLLFVIATPFGVLAAAAVFFLRSLTVEPLVLRAILKITGQGWGAYLLHIRGALMATGLAALAGFGTAAFLGAGAAPVITLAVAGGLAGALYLTALLLLDRDFVTELRGMAAIGGKRA